MPGRAGRCIGVQKPAVHVGGDAEWTFGLRRRGISAGASTACRGGERQRQGERKKASHSGCAKGPFPRREDLRHFRHPEPEASRGGADVPRIAYAYSLARSERQRQRLYLRVGHIVCASAGRTGWVLRRKAGQRPEYGALSYRGDQGSGGCAAGREGGVQPPGFYGSEEGRDERSEQGRTPLQKGLGKAGENDSLQGRHV